MALFVGAVVWFIGMVGIGRFASDGGGDFVPLALFMCAVLAATGTSTYLRGARRWVTPASMSVLVLGGMMTVAAMSVVDVPEAAAPMTLLVFFTFTMLRLHPRPATLAAAPSILVHQVVIAGNNRAGELSDTAFAVASSIPVSAFVAGLIVSVVLEREARATFTNERVIEAQQREITTERDRAEGLLLNILPAPIAERLQAEPGVIADSFDEVTVLFADVVGFTPMSSRVPAEETVRLLNEVFTTFDALADQHGVEKIKTIGDAYMAVGGLPDPRPDHAEAMADFALAMRDAAFDLGVTMRIGISTGPAVAGVIGTHKFAYDLWGDTVNTASRMESHGVPGEIQVSEATYEKLESDYVLVERGPQAVKGKGTLPTWLLKGKK